MTISEAKKYQTSIIILYELLQMREKNAGKDGFVEMRLSPKQVEIIEKSLALNYGVVELDIKNQEGHTDESQVQTEEN